MGEAEIILCILSLRKLRPKEREEKKFTYNHSMPKFTPLVMVEYLLSIMLSTISISDFRGFQISKYLHRLLVEHP